MHKNSTFAQKEADLQLQLTFSSDYVISMIASFCWQFINGGSLHDILCDDLTIDVSWDERIQIAQDVTSGMKYLHSKGIFHRDLTSRVS